MFDYLQQFNRLSKELRDAVSSPEAMKFLDEIEAKHGIKLASAVMRIMVKDLPLVKLPLFLASEFSLNEDESRKIVEDLKNGVLRKAASHLGFTPSVVPDNFDEKIGEILKKGVISFSSQNLIDRFKSAAKTYLHGVRGKIDTRLVLQKSIDAGGLGLSIDKVDSILSLLDGNTPKEPVLKKSSALDSLIAKSIIQPEYSLASAIEERKKKLLSEKELIKGEELVDLPLAQAQQDLPFLEKQEKIQDSVPVNLPFADLKKEIPEINKKKELLVEQDDDDIASPEEIAAFLKKISQDQTPEKPTITPKPVEVKEVKELPVPIIPPVVVPPVVIPPVPLVVPPVPQENQPKEGDVNIKISQTPKEEKPEADGEASTKIPEIGDGASFKIIPTANLVIPTRTVAAPAPTLKIAPVTASSNQGRVRMDDVKAAPRVMGPIEELRFLDVVSFRRLSNNPSEATAKILSKIKLLERNGYDRMTAGIAAWRQSETSHLYLKMCHDSAFQSKPLSEIIEACQMKNEECLTQEEIDAIMSLNAKLLF
ncbi:MAG: hypothetical protein ACOYMB_03930 [Patescibacteria group bacterium]